MDAREQALQTVIEDAVKMNDARVLALQSAIDAINVNVEYMRDKADIHREQLAGENAKTLEKGNFYERHSKGLAECEKYIATAKGIVDELLQAIDERK